MPIKVLQAPLPDFQSLRRPCTLYTCHNDGITYGKIWFFPRNQVCGTSIQYWNPKLHTHVKRIVLPLLILLKLYKLFCCLKKKTPRRQKKKGFEHKFSTNKLLQDLNAYAQ